MKEQIDKIREIMGKEDQDILKVSLTKVRRILEWANDNENFDSSFVADMGNRLTEEKPMSDKQLMAINNIYNRFGVDDWYVQNRK